MSDYDDLKAVREEAETTQEFARKAYSGLGARDFYQQSVLRSLGVIIKLLLYIASK